MNCGSILSANNTVRKPFNSDCWANSKRLAGNKEEKEKNVVKCPLTPWLIVRGMTIDFCGGKATVFLLDINIH